MLVNFGGPQGHQIATMLSRPAIFDRIRASMDVVTWDPRGYPGLSSPVLRCDRGLLRTPAFPADQAGFDRLVADNKARGDRCRDTDPELFDHMDSASDARDADAVRRALGEDRMNLIGLSYGGAIAQSYARLFPGRVRTLYVDGTRNHGARDWERELDTQARENERLIERFFDWAPPGMGKRWRALTAAADREPIPGLPGGGVKECLDFPRPAGHAELARTVRRLRAIAPGTGAAFPLAWHLPVTCAGWPAPVTNPPAPLPRGLPPILGAGTWLDFDSTRRVTGQVPGSRTIEYDGPGHNLFAPMADPCVIDHVSSYVTTRRLPARGTVCP